MKSTIEQLEKRGFLTESRFRSVEKRSNESLLNSPVAYERTAGVRKLRSETTERNLGILCLLLEKEKSLYTKLELCDAIVDYGCCAVGKLDTLIGKIGNNQHREVNNSDIRKRTYPLPRDLSARIMTRIGECVLSYYQGRMGEYYEKQLSEIVDAIGHITFHSRNETMEDELIQIYHTTESGLIAWKIVKAFQGFDSQTVKRILEKELESINYSMRVEAKRSLEIIQRRKGNVDNVLQKKL